MGREGPYKASWGELDQLLQELLVINKPSNQGYGLPLFSSPQTKAGLGRKKKTKINHFILKSVYSRGSSIILYTAYSISLRPNYAWTPILNFQPTYPFLPNYIDFLICLTSLTFCFNLKKSIYIYIYNFRHSYIVAYWITFVCFFLK
uniref:SJCHGC06907 protein n=1 Tax=Schistosoma japonicum TaxID=6182 RepID=Q5DFX0_SCHJA|nr:SJCHGC06907 protein [Schistosoma japonicum]